MPPELLSASVQAGFPLLSALVFGPILAGLLALFAPSEAAARRVALVSTGLSLGLTLLAVGLFHPDHPGFQLVERRLWIPTLNVQYLLGVDGISLLMLPTTALLFVGALVAARTSVTVQVRAFLAVLLGLEGVLFGALTSLDLVLFFMFWELMLVPLYFLVALWGVGPERRFAALKYTLFMLAGGLPLLLAIVALGLAHQELRGGLAFDLISLRGLPLPDGRALTIFLLLLVGFGVKVPLWPAHTWLPTVAMEGRAGTAAVLLGLKLGIYGLIRVAYPLLPQAAARCFWLVALPGAIGVVYGALIALQQRNLRRMLAYSSMSHAGMLALGLAVGGVSALAGVAWQLACLALTTGGLALLVGFLFQRRGTSDLGTLSGLHASAPRMSALFLLVALASVGMPGTAGFIGEFLVIRGIADRSLGLAIVAMVGALLGAAAVFGAWSRAFLGAPRVEVADLRPGEFAFSLMIALVLLVFGLMPGSVLSLVASSLAP